MNLRSLLAAAALASSLALPGAGRAADLPMTAEEFGLWRDYQDALLDKRVQAMPEKARLPAIAKNFKVTEKKLRDALAKGEAHGEGMGKLVEEISRNAIAGTEVAARLKELRVDATAAHVVAYVSWIGSSAEMVDREACLAATRIEKANPLAATIKVEILDPADDRQKLFEALISRSNAGRIQEDRIVDFASTRYIKLFEKVKRAEP